jgi:hypothetical protein
MGCKIDQSSKNFTVNWANVYGKYSDTRKNFESNLKENK